MAQNRYFLFPAAYGTAATCGASLSGAPAPYGSKRKNFGPLRLITFRCCRNRSRSVMVAAKYAALFLVMESFCWAQREVFDRTQPGGGPPAVILPGDAE